MLRQLVENFSNIVCEKEKVYSIPLTKNPPCAIIGHNEEREPKQEERQMTTEERKAEIKAMLVKFQREGIRNGTTKGTAEVVRYQDLVMQATDQELHDIEHALTDQERHTFFWANSCTLDQNTVCSIFMKTVGRRKILALYESERKDLQAWEDRLNAVTVQQAEDFNAKEERVRQAERHATACKEALESVRHQLGECINECSALCDKLYAEQSIAESRRADIEAMEKELQDFAAMKRVIAAAVKGE